MSYFLRKSDTTVTMLRKGADFKSMDAGGKDAGAANFGKDQTSPQMYPTQHMRMVADQHDNEGDIHSDIADKHKMIGLDKRGAEHSKAATEHKLAASHYRAAATAVENARDTADPQNGKETDYLDAGKKHLEAARGCAKDAADCTAAMK